MQSGRDKLGIYIKNTGVGPAIIRKVQAFYKGKEVGSWDDISQDNRHIWKDITPNFLTMRGSDTYLPANQQFAVYETDKLNIQDFEALRKLFQQHIAVRVDYCSVYQECQYSCVGEAACKKSPNK